LISCDESAVATDFWKIRKDVSRLPKDGAHIPRAERGEREATGERRKKCDQGDQIKEHRGISNSYEETNTFKSFQSETWKEKTASEISVDASKIKKVKLSL
jgi:hypothetical protein